MNIWPCQGWHATATGHMASEAVQYLAGRVSKAIQTATLCHEFLGNLLPSLAQSTHWDIIVRWKPFISFFRLLFSPRSHRWQNLHFAPLLQPSL